MEIKTSEHEYKSHERLRCGEICIRMWHQSNCAFDFGALRYVQHILTLRPTSHSADLS
jgi:hypothetical protein